MKRDAEVSEAVDNRKKRILQREEQKNVYAEKLKGTATYN
jgi:hypothetical protein